MMDRTTLWMLGLLPVVACAEHEDVEQEGPVEERVLNGTDTPEHDKSIFNLAKGEPICTASNVKYPRCMLTAAHCVDGETAANLEIYQGQNTFAWDQANSKYKANAAAKRQTVDKFADRGAGLDKRWHDLAVMWIEKKEGNDPPRIADGDYTQLEWVNSTPLKNHEYEGVSTYTSMGGPVQMTVFGYGPKDNGQTLGVKRKGQVRVQAYHLGPSQKTPQMGSFYNIKVDPKVDPQQFPCQGDSGGPLLYEGKIVGVASEAVTLGGCETPAVARYTGLEKEAVMGSDSNHDWLVKTIEKTCAKQADSKTEPGGTDKKRGKVAGSISPGQSWIEGDILNNALTCGDYPAWTDCTELVHHGQTLTLTAIETDPDWEFDRWETDAHCACDGSTAPVCVLDYDDIGVYDATTSSDRASCIARFVPKGDTTGTGDTGDSSGDSGSASGSTSTGSSTSGDGTSTGDWTSTSGDGTSTGDWSTTSGAGTSTGWTTDPTHDTLWIADMGGWGTTGGWTSGVITTWATGAGDGTSWGESGAWTSGEGTSWVTHPGTGGWDGSGDSGTTATPGDLGTGSECAPCHEASEYTVAADAGSHALAHELDASAIATLRASQAL